MKMSQVTYEVTVKLPNGTNEHVIIEASTIGNARMMAESQYGKGSVVNVSHKR